MCTSQNLEMVLSLFKSLFTDILCINNITNLLASYIIVENRNKQLFTINYLIFPFSVYLHKGQQKIFISCDVAS